MATAPVTANETTTGRVASVDIMRGIVMVDTTEDYQAWLQEQSTFAQLTEPEQVGLADEIQR